ncbi:MAG: protein kinase [Myxococcota bacterium]
MAGKTPPEPISIGRYRVLRWLRDTALAHVYQCERLMDEASPAVELHVLSAEHHEQPNKISQFISRGRVGARLKHRGLPRILEVSGAGEVPYAVHAWVEGPTLHQLQTEKGWGRSLDLRMVVRLGLDVSEALAHAFLAEDVHGEPIAMIHGGLSPDRIVMAPEGFARVIDFGTPAGPRYHAPEVLAGATWSARADVYALGVVLYALVTGQHAWPGTDADPRRTGRLISPRTIRADVPPDLDSIVLGCLETRPIDRPRDAVVLGEILADWLLDHGGPVDDAELAAWGVEDAPSDGPRLVGGTRPGGARRIRAPSSTSSAEAPTRPAHRTSPEPPTAPDLLATIRDEPAPGAEAITVPHPGAIAARLEAAGVLKPEERFRPVWAAVALVAVAAVGGVVLAWFGPALGLPAADFGSLIQRLEAWMPQ